MNDNLMELLLTISALKRASVHYVIAVVPYYGYARMVMPYAIAHCESPNRTARQDLGSRSVLLMLLE